MHSHLEVRQYHNVMEVLPCGGGLCLVWGGVVAHIRTEIIIRGTMNALRFQDEIPVNYAMPAMNNIRIRVFQHDNARPYIAGICHEYTQQYDVQVLPWPALSPDVTQRTLVGCFGETWGLR